MHRGRIDYILPFFVVLLLVLVIIYCNATSFPAIDFTAYYYAAKAIAIGTNPYDLPTLQEIASREGYTGYVNEYVYPPPVAVFMQVWGGVPITLAVSLWRIGNVLLFIISFVLIARLARTVTAEGHSTMPIFGKEMDLPLMATAISSLALLYPLQADLKNGQANILVVFLQMLFLYPKEKHILHRSPVILGLVSWIKIIPAVYVIFYFLSKRYRRIAGFAAVCAGIAVLSVLFSSLGPWKDYLEYVRAGVEGHPGQNLRIADFFNGSLWGVLTRFLGDRHVLVEFLCGAAVTAFLAFLFKFRHDFRKQENVGFLILSLIAGSLIVTPFFWLHHCTMLLPGVAISVSSLLSRRDGRFIPLLLIVLAVLTAFPFYKVALSLADHPGVADMISTLNLLGLVGLIVTSVVSMTVLRGSTGLSHQH